LARWDPCDFGSSLSLSRAGPTDACTLVTAATYRLPGPLAITVAQVDEMSGRYADDFNAAFRPPQETAAAFERVRGAYGKAGASTVYLQVLDLADLDHLDLLASQVLPQV
jgi:hypothetical protein